MAEREGPEEGLERGGSSDSETAQLLDSSASSLSPIKLVVMVGFHHSKGHHVEWAFPKPFTAQDWRHLPLLCLPEGSFS